MEPRETALALLHHPMRDRTGAIVTTALTTLDLHDMARTCRTYDLARLYIVHPLVPQRAIAERILAHWEGDDARHDFRGEALRRVRVLATLEEAQADARGLFGSAPQLIATTAQARPGSIDLPAARALAGPSMLLFGTGFGMTEELLSKSNHVLGPIRGGDYNHLSVRSACAILLDRLYGDRKD